MAVDINKLADSVIESATAAIARLFAKKEAELTALFEKRLAELPAPKDGKDGIDGKDSDPAEITKSVMAMVTTFLDEIPVPKDGADGKDGESPDVDVAEIAKQAAGLIEQPNDGKDGVDGADGKDADPALIKAEVERVFSTLPIPIDGRDGRDGKDGNPGRDALHLEIIPAIDEAKVYPRNTFAKHQNGFWRSFEKTDGMKGWECLVAGIASIEMSHDGEREFAFKAVLSDGTTSDLVATPAIPLDRGVFREGVAYSKGDGCTWGGCFWIAKNDTSTKPREGDDWRLAVKSGRDGSSPYDIARRNGFIGSEVEWLASLRGKDGKDMTGSRN